MVKATVVHDLRFASKVIESAREGDAVEDGRPAPDVVAAGFLTSPSTDTLRLWISWTMTDTSGEAMYLASRRVRSTFTHWVLDGAVGAGAVSLPRGRQGRPRAGGRGGGW